MTVPRAPFVAALLTLVVGAAATAVPARAQDGCEGVRVVVDAVGVGGEVTTRCAAGDPGSGLEALQGAGHRYTFVPRQPGLVCTIDARPDPCNGAPQDAYWSYWHAEAGGSWTYSTRGAGNRDPEPGTVEGWAFGAGDPPRRPPPAAAPPPEPEATAEPTREPATTEEPAAPPARPAPTADDAEDTGTADEPRAGDAPSVTTPTPTPTSVAGLPSPTTSPTELDDPPGPVEPATASPTPAPVAGEVTTGGGGAPVGLLAGGLLIAGLAGAGLVRARRRADG